MVLSYGDSAPDFIAPTASVERFSFGTVAGRYIVLGFFPADAALSAPFGAALNVHRNLFDDRRACFFGVLRDPHQIAEARDGLPGIRWFLDPEGKVAAIYGATDQPHWLVLDPAMRVLFAGAPEAWPEIMARIAALPPVDDYAGGEMSAPVLILPRVFEPEFCERLIALYEAQGGQPSGVMKEQNGQTVLVADVQHKKRSDLRIDDEQIIAAARTRIQRRLVPPILKSFQFRATRIERHIVACYDSDTGGFFRPHRDNTTKGTAHRRFAVTINLNAGAYDGGDLRFPEFGSRTYRAPTGGAVVFSCSLLHEATPVTRGKRYAYLPFLYDEAGAKIREENMAFVEPHLRGYRSGPADQPSESTMMRSPSA